MSRSGRGRGDGGLSLVEVLVAITILAFVAIGVQSTLNTALRQNKLALERSQATSLAMARLNQITSMRYLGAANYAAYAVPGETAAAGPPKTLTAGVGSIPGAPQFSRTVTLKYDVPAAGILTVQVDVAWTNRGHGTQKTHRLVTFIQPGLQEK